MLRMILPLKSLLGASGFYQLWRYRSYFQRHYCGSCPTSWTQWWKLVATFVCDVFQSNIFGEPFAASATAAGKARARSTWGPRWKAERIPAGKCRSTLRNRQENMSIAGSPCQNFHFAVMQSFCFGSLRWWIKKCLLVLLLAIEKQFPHTHAYCYGSMSRWRRTKVPDNSPFAVEQKKWQQFFLESCSCRCYIWCKYVCLLQKNDTSHTQRHTHTRSILSSRCVTQIWENDACGVVRSFFPQIAASYRGSNFSRGDIVLANWPTSGCCSECCAGCCPGCCCGCCPGCCAGLLSGVLRIMFAIGRCQGAVRIMFAIGRCLCRVLSGCSVLSRVLLRVLSRVLCRGAVRGAPDHVCHWAVSGCCPGCCAGVLFRVLRIMFAIGWCQNCPGCSPGCSGSCLPLGCVRVLSRVQGAVQGAPDHVCHWAVSGCCPGCSGSCLPLGGGRVLSRVLSRGAVEGCCPGCSGSCLPGRCPAVLSRLLRITFAIGRCQGAVNSTF